MKQIPSIIVHSILHFNKILTSVIGVLQPVMALFFCIFFESIVYKSKRKNMKKIMMIVLIATISLSASAQRGFKGRVSYPRTHVVVTYARPYYPYGFYDPFYYPYYYPNYYPRETRLDVRIADIRSDYREKIWSARHDKKLKKSERKAMVHQLKRDRDKAINDAKENYYKSH